MNAILRTGETWLERPAGSGIFVERLNYLVFRPVPGKDHNVPDSFAQIVRKLALEPESLGAEIIEGSALLTGRMKIIGSDSPMLVAQKSDDPG